MMNRHRAAGPIDDQLFQEVYLRAYIQEQQRIVQMKQLHQLGQKTLISVEKASVEFACTQINPQQAVFQQPKDLHVPQLLQQQDPQVQEASAQQNYLHHQYISAAEEKERLQQQQYLYQQLLNQQQLHFYQFKQQKQLMTNYTHHQWGDVNNNTIEELLAENSRTQACPTLNYPLGDGFTLRVGESCLPNYTSFQKEQEQKRKCSSASDPYSSTKRIRWEERVAGGQSASAPPSNQEVTALADKFTANFGSSIQALFQQMQNNSAAALAATVKQDPKEEDDYDDIEVLASFTKQQNKMPARQETEKEGKHEEISKQLDHQNLACSAKPPTKGCYVQITASNHCSGGGTADRPSTSLDTEEESFVDVVGGVEGVPNYTRAQRKAHIEFYRKIKSFRNRERTLECQMCQEKMANTESCIRSHVYSHSDSPLYVCKMCIKGYKEQHLIFEHIKETHPGKDHQFFEDRRDMSMLTELLMSCFPRSGPKCRSTYIQMLDQLIKLAVDNLACQLCAKEVPCKRSALIKHLHIHPSYRCKKCKFISLEELEQLKHCQAEHPEKSLTEGTDLLPTYNVSMALEVLSSTLKKCFFGHYCGLLESAK